MYRTSLKTFFDTIPQQHKAVENGRFYTQAIQLLVQEVHQLTGWQVTGSAAVTCSHARCTLLCRQDA